ncbi:flagellar protein FlgN [Halobacillus litoralis]|uniref:flagellar protein FlgN n=1 Tax=Halobacillus litoralis TaxID=45668 RepID=UPI001CFEFBB8|nr:flagellar protein FlgN [Halobacillus litoralis]
MTITGIINPLSQLKQLHDSLLTLSKRKTEALKKNETTEMQQVLTQERKHIQAIQKIENQRMTAVEEWFNGKGIRKEQWTISVLIDALEGEEKRELQTVYEGLVLVLADLKQQESLNAELIQQSMQFINLSLNMLQPSLQTMNYGSQETRGSEETPKRSLFDSKA